MDSDVKGTLQHGLPPHHEDKDHEKIREQVVELCEKVHGIVEEHPDIVVWNADQIGLVKEATGKRTLARKGMKKVECVAPSVGATTSSITLLSIFRSDGYLKPKIFVQFGERGGVLPQKGYQVYLQKVDQSNSSFEDEKIIA